jgi:hypothetical protein
LCCVVHNLLSYPVFSPTFILVDIKRQSVKWLQRMWCSAQRGYLLPKDSSP